MSQDLHSLKFSLPQQVSGAYSSTYLFSCDGVVVYQRVCMASLSVADHVQPVPTRLLCGRQ